MENVRPAGGLAAFHGSAWRCTASIGTSTHNLPMPQHAARSVSSALAVAAYIPILSQDEHACIYPQGYVGHLEPLTMQPEIDIDPCIDTPCHKPITYLTGMHVSNSLGQIVYTPTCIYSFQCIYVQAYVNVLVNVSVRIYGVSHMCS